MKITSVDVIKVLDGKPSVPGTPWNPICVRINTDEGISGFGEAGLCYGNANHAAFGCCVDFGELIIGMDPMRIEAIWDKLHRSTFWGMGGGGVIFSAMSAIDIACWDIKGKALGVPVYQLLGGKTNDKLRAMPVRFSVTGARNAMHSLILKNMQRLPVRQWRKAILR